MITKLPLKFNNGIIVYTTKFAISRLDDGFLLIIHFFDDDGCLIEAEEVMTWEQSFPYRKALLDGLLMIRQAKGE